MRLKVFQFRGKLSQKRSLWINVTKLTKQSRKSNFQKKKCHLHHLKTHHAHIRHQTFDNINQDVMTGSAVDINSGSILSEWTIRSSMLTQRGFPPNRFQQDYLQLCKQSYTDCSGCSYLLLFCLTIVLPRVDDVNTEDMDAACSNQRWSFPQTKSSDITPLFTSFRGRASC